MKRLFSNKLAASLYNYCINDNDFLSSCRDYLKITDNNSIHPAVNSIKFADIQFYLNYDTNSKKNNDLDNIVIEVYNGVCIYLRNLFTTNDYDYYSSYGKNLNKIIKESLFIQKSFYTIVVKYATEVLKMKGVSMKSYFE